MSSHPIQIRHLVLAWAKSHGHEHFSLSRPKLLSMMRIVDDDRSGSIGFREFRNFAQLCLAEKAEEEKMDADEESQRTACDYHNTMTPNPLSSGFPSSNLRIVTNSSASV